MIKQLLNNHLEIIEKLNEDAQINQINKLGTLIKSALKNNNTIFFMGNGGSAADSQHLAAEFVGRFKKERGALPALALTTDTSIITAIGNDYGFDEIYKRQVQALVKENDIVVGISTSGNSKNIILALIEAKERGAFTVGFIGKDGGEMLEFADLSIVVPSNDTARIQEAHILIGHILCEIAEMED